MPGRPSWFSDRSKSENSVEDVEKSCFLSSFTEFHSAVAEKSKMSQPIRGQGGHLGFPIGLTNMVKDVKILLPVKFGSILFIGCRERKSKMSQPIIGQGGHICLSDRPEKR